MNDQMIKVMVALQSLWQHWNDPVERDRGSATETAIIVGVVAVAALGLTVVIAAAIERYSGQIP